MAGEEDNEFMPVGTPAQRMRAAETGVRRGTEPAAPPQNPTEVHAVGQLMEEGKKRGAAQRFYDWARNIATGSGGHVISTPGSDSRNNG